MKHVCRFAPSPTGYIHVGNIRTALYNWFIAKSQGGRFILRLDDTDKIRSKTHFAEAITNDLAWLGIAPDKTYNQSKRLELYDGIAQKLKDSQLLYPAYETPEELEYKRKSQLGRGMAPVYDRSALKLSEDQRRALEAKGHKPHWRFKLPGEIIHFNDLIKGEQQIDLQSLSDPVLIRADNSYLYTLPSIADDIDMGVSHVIRGDDHVTNTAAQIAIFRALDEKPPLFAHHNLLISGEGKGFSKRDGSMSIASLRASGFESLAVAIAASLIGTSEALRIFDDLEQLASAFELSTVSRSPATFRLDTLQSLNEKIIHQLPFEAVSSRLNHEGIDCDKRFWLAIRGNISNWHEAITWWKIIHNPKLPKTDPVDHEYLKAAAKLLPPEPWDSDTMRLWSVQIKSKTGRKGRSLFRPLRFRLTGQEHGPELANILPLLGYQKTHKRLCAD